MTNFHYMFGLRRRERPSREAEIYENVCESGYFNELITIFN